MVNIFPILAAKKHPLAPSKKWKIALLSIVSIVGVWLLWQSMGTTAEIASLEEVAYDSELDSEVVSELSPAVSLQPYKPYIPATPLNIVVIMTDDQRWDTLWAMPILQNKLIRNGVHFTNAFVSTPLCCPDRASFLAGGFYAHNTGVLTNDFPNGGAQKFMDIDSLATRLQAVGYKTAMIGKYLNGYPQLWPSSDTPYIPPGWTKFVQATNFLGEEAAVGSSRFDASSTGTLVPYDQYLLDFLKEQTFSFLDEVGDAPFFLYFTPFAPHAPAIPAPGDEELFARYLYRNRAYAEQDLSDKPAWVRESVSKYKVDKEDEFHRNQLRSLQAVDRAVGAIIDKLKEMGKSEHTVIFYTADNGYLWGEHWLTSKNKPYEESIRVPLVVATPGILPRQDNHRVMANLDIPTTIFEVAGISRDTDGVNLLPLLNDPYITPWRPYGKAALIEGFGGKLTGVIWAGLRGGRYKYVEYSTGEKEFYDLKRDTCELENQINNPSYKDVIERFAKRLHSFKGLAIIVTEAPKGVVGQDYYFEVKVWGGISPYRWEVVEGSLPEGLELDSSTGSISGKPTQATKKNGVLVLIKVEDSSIAKHTGKPQAYVQKFKLIIASSKMAVVQEIEVHKQEEEPEDED